MGYPSYKQEKPYWCGPAALKVVHETLYRFPIKYSQAQWAERAGTTTEGTTTNGLKKALRLFANFEIVRKQIEPFKRECVGIVYDRKRDHWLAFHFKPATEVHYAKTDVIEVYDPETDAHTYLKWPDFQTKFLNSKRNSYALVCEMTDV